MVGRTRPSVENDHRCFARFQVTHYPIVGFARFPGGWDIKHSFPFLNVDVSHVCSEFYRSKIRTTEQASYGAFK